MKRLLIILFVGIFAIPAIGQTNKPDPSKKIQIVDASCGQCQFKMKDKKGCDLAVRIDGKAYFVEGTTIDQHGDAHADDGFCEAIRKAEVQGDIVNNRFKVTYFKLLKADPKEEPKKNKP